MDVLEGNMEDAPGLAGVARVFAGGPRFKQQGSSSELGRSQCGGLAGNPSSNNDQIIGVNVHDSPLKNAGKKFRRPCEMCVDALSGRSGAAPMRAVS